MPSYADISSTTQLFLGLKHYSKPSAEGTLPDGIGTIEVGARLMELDAVKGTVTEYIWYAEPDQFSATQTTKRNTAARGRWYQLPDPAVRLAGIEELLSAFKTESQAQSALLRTITSPLKAEEGV